MNEPSQLEEFPLRPVEFQVLVALASNDRHGAQIGRIRRIGAGGYALFALSNFFPTTSHESQSDQRAELLRKQMRQIVVIANEPRVSMKRSREARERQ